MGYKEVWAYFQSTGGEGFYAYADVEWDSSYYVTIGNIRYSSEADAYWFKWRVGARGNTGNPLAGTDLGPKYSFQGSQNGQYVFQACTRESASPWGGTWESGGFTLTADSGGGGGGTTEYININYNKNGYTWKSFPSNQKIVSGTRITIPSATPPDETSTSNNFTITGNANGGTFPSGATTRLTSKKTTTKTYVFDGWYDQYDRYYYDNEVSYIYENLTLYAQQSNYDSESYSNNNVSALTKPNPPASTSATYTVTFNPNGGLLDILEQTVNTTITKVFSRWSSSSTGGNTVTTMTQTGTVYAQWSNQYSNNTIILPLPTKKGYIFNGWSKTSNGTNLLPAGQSVSITKDTTYYAIWGEQEKPTGGMVFIHDGTIWQPATGYIFNNESWTLSG